MREPNVFFLLAGLGLAVAALWLMWRGRTLRGASGVPEGRVIASDAGDWFATPESLASPELRLVGRPDYLVAEANGEIVPVEVKSRPAPSRPYESHILQPAAYCLLVERHYGVRPPHGILQYADRAFSVEYTPSLERDLIRVLAAMRADRKESDVARDHDEPGRCRACGVREACDHALA